MSEAQRHYVYMVCAAIIAVLAFYGVIALDAIPVWMGLIVAVLGIGTNVLAVKNTDPKNGGGS